MVGVGHAGPPGGTDGWGTSMTTYILSGYERDYRSTSRTDFQGTTRSQSDEVGETTFSITVDDGTRLSYNAAPGSEKTLYLDLPEVEFSGTGYLGGAPGLTNYTFTDSYSDEYYSSYYEDGIGLARIEWSDIYGNARTSTVLSLSSYASDSFDDYESGRSSSDERRSEAVFVLDGDSLPLMRTTDAWDTFEMSITSRVAITSGLFSPYLFDLEQSTKVEVTQNDVFYSSGDGFSVDGGAGDDVFKEADGDETFHGGLGIDTIDFGNDYDGVAVSLAAGISTAYGQYSDSGTDTFTGIENVIGSDDDDWIGGDAGRNVLSGGGGNDTIKTRGGEDTVFGNRGDDRIIGSDDAEELYGNRGEDIIQGLGGDDFIAGGHDDDYLYGGRGDDRVEGGFGDDTLKGNLGDDLLKGGNGTDRLFGGGNDDTLDGGWGQDYLYGEGGSDRIEGGFGNDSLSGGWFDRNDGAQDVFVFTPGGGSDRIMDFENGIDRIDLSAFEFSSFNFGVRPLIEAAGGGKNTRIDFGGDGELYLFGVRESDLNIADFIL